MLTPLHSLDHHLYFLFSFFKKNYLPCVVLPTFVGFSRTPTIFEKDIELSSWKFGGGGKSVVKQGADL